jgi:protein-tyrosine phosphatase
VAVPVADVLRLVTMRSLIFVCTANVCRSPVAEQLLRERLVDRRDADGEAWAVRSAGLGRFRAEVDAHTRRAVTPLGLDLSDHRPRVLTRAVVNTEGADLVLTMTREQLRAVATLVPDAWPRTFTLKEFARRSSMTGPPQPDESVPAWIARLSAGRKAADLVRADPADDIADPYGLAQRHYDAMVEEVREAVDALVSTVWLGRGHAPSPTAGTTADETARSQQA